LTLEEAKNILRIDTNDEDIHIQTLIDALPTYIFERTGYPIDKQNAEPICRLLEKFLVYKFYINDEEVNYLDRTIESLITTLKFKVASLISEEESGEQAAIVDDVLP